MRIFFDTEFLDTGSSIELLSIGLVTEQGREYYAEPPANARSANDWVRTNVLPLLGADKKSRGRVANEIIDFAGIAPEFWADYGAYDWVALCQLYGTMMDLPESWPMYVRELRMIAPNATLHPSYPHHALSDAQALRDFVLSNNL